ncbi:LppU/SCO3897 family protein [Nocardia thraciensis]
MINLRQRKAHLAAASIALIAVAGGCSDSDPLARPEQTPTSAVQKTSAAPNLVEKGDCVYDNGTDYTEAPCGSSASTYIALERLPGDQADCRPVPGVYYTYVDNTTPSPAKVCLGFKDIAPADGINIAQPGDCMLVPAGGKSARRVPCTAPDAYRIVDRRERSVVTNSTCHDVPGARRAYGWRLKMTGPFALDDPSGAPKVYDVVLCIAPA